MPELKPLPCPAWACQGELVECKQDGENFFIECTECSMRGPVECDPYHAQQSWDWIPRALTWTHEPPKVAGFYFLKMASGTISMVYLSEQDIKDKDWHGCAGQWVAIAGPIPAPLD